jgi:hypothetical protein
LWLGSLRTASLIPLSTTFVHILAQGRGLSKGKFEQILKKQGLSRVDFKKHNMAGVEGASPLPAVLTWLIQVARDVLVKQAKLRQAM